MPPAQGPENLMTTDEIIGICVIVIGVTISIIRLLCIIKRKKRKKRKDSENLNFQPDELPLRRTAADHLEEIKEATQRAVRSVRSLSIQIPKESHSPLDNSSFFSSPQVEKRKSSSYVNSTRSSESFSRKVGPRLISKNNSKHNSRVASLRRSSLTIKPRKKFPPTPPPSPLKFQHDIIEVDPIRMSLINTLLSNISKSTYTLPSSSKTSSRVPSKVQSRTELRIGSRQSRMGSRASSNSSIPSQSTSSSRPSSRISL